MPEYQKEKEEKSVHKIKVISLEEKIQILEKFSETGEILVGKTIFEGHPVGKWAISIRYEINKNKDKGKNGKRIVGPTKDQLERLEKLGIIGMRMNTTIDEKIDRLIEWRKKYPKATIISMVSIENLKEYAKTEDEITRFWIEYKKMTRYYEYVVTRKSKGKLNEEQIKRCIEGNIGGVFEREKLKSERNELKNKYGLKEETIRLIKQEYGSIDKFRKVYKSVIINQSGFDDINRKILKDANLNRAFDISSPDWNLRNHELDYIINKIFEKKHIIIKYDDLKEKVIEQIKGRDFTKQEEEVLCMLYGANGEEKLSIPQIADNMGVTTVRIRQIIDNAEIKILHPICIKQLDLRNIEYNIDHDLRKEIIEEYFENFDIFVTKEPIDMDKDLKIKLTNMLSEAVRKTKKRDEYVEIIKRMPKKQRLEILRATFGEKIKNSDFSIIPEWSYMYKEFNRKNGIEINEELLDREFISEIYRECVDLEYIQSKIAEFMITDFTDSELIEAIDKKELEEIIANNRYFSEEKRNKLKELLEQRKKKAVKEKIFDDIKNLEKSTEIPLRRLCLSRDLCNCLLKAGIETVQDLMKKTEKELMKIRGFSKKYCRDIVQSMERLGIKMVDGHFKLDDKELSNHNQERKNNMVESLRTKIEAEISKYDVLSESEKQVLKQVLDKKCKKISKENIFLEEVNDIKVISGNIMKIDLEELNLSAGLNNALRREGIETVHDVMGKSHLELKKVRNIGKQYYNELITKMQLLGIKMVDGHFEFEDKEFPRNNQEQKSNMNGDIKAEIETEISSYEDFSESEKEVLRKMIYEKYQKTESNKKVVSSNIMESKIEDLNISVGLYNALKKSGIDRVRDIVGKTELELKKIRNLGQKRYKELIETMKSLGIKMVKSQFVNENLRDVDKQSNHACLEGIESKETLKEMSKEELVKHILEQQRIIEGQRDEIDRLSSQRGER